MELNLDYKIQIYMLQHIKVRKLIEGFVNVF